MCRYIDCHRCRHYYVTWDKRFPHGCRAMKFKSKELPSCVVGKSSGMPCLLFKVKDRTGNKCNQ
ncbi:MAG: uracil-DNA glycosylase [Deltaproteobacteria bacterium]|nr:MAG: uracil-DNA glycosylase [Deltaproteobacteria bacterium]